MEGIAPNPVDAPWPNTYGIWADELKMVRLEHLLEHRWSDTVSYFGDGGSTAQDQSHTHSDGLNHAQVSELGRLFHLGGAASFLQSKIVQYCFCSEKFGCNLVS